MAEGKYPGKTNLEERPFPQDCGSDLTGESRVAAH